MASRIIMHVDLDAFFAAVEQRENLELKGKSVIIGADPKEGNGRGVVSTASYEAREFGIRSAMPISRAWKLCPEGIYLRPNFGLYEKVSAKVIEILRKHAGKLEQAGIDEAFLDVSGKVKDFDEALGLADRIRKEILRKERITCSVGIGSSKLVAKMASDYRKPYGLTLVKDDKVKKFMNLLPARKLPGVGPKTEIRLRSFGIKTIGDLARFNKETLIKAFGKWGAEMHELANGIDDSEVVEEYEAKSIGREVTFEKDTNDVGVINKRIDALVDEFHPEIIAGNMDFKTVSVKVRYENFETQTSAKTFKFYTRDKEVIKATAKQLVGKFLNSKKVRLVGARVTGLKFGEKQTILKINKLK